MLLPEMITKVLPRLVRFDLAFDLPEHILPDPAPAIYLTTRPDLRAVAQGRLIIIDNSSCTRCSQGAGTHSSNQ